MSAPVFAPGSRPAKAPAPFPPPVSDQRAEASFVLGLLGWRWLAGIIENYGARNLSQAAALMLLSGLLLLFLRRMRLASHSAVFVLGALAWAATGAFSLAANPQADLQKAVALLTLLLLYALFANAGITYLRTPHALRMIYRFLAAFLIVGCLLSLVQVLSGNGFVEQGKARIQRAFGSDVHPVSFAIQLLGAMIGLELARLRLGRAAGALHAMLIGAGLIALYLTYARTAWLMGLATLALTLLARGSWLRRFVLGGGGLILGLILLANSSRFADLASLPAFLKNFSPSDMVFDWRYVNNSLSWRIVNWSFGFNQALEQPVLGFGPGQSALASYFHLEMHNLFLESLFEGGIFGLGSLLLALAGLVRLHRQLPRITTADKHARTLINSFGLTLLVAVTFSTSFVDQLMSFLLYLLAISAAGAQQATGTAVLHAILHRRGAKQWPAHSPTMAQTAANSL